MPKRDLLKHVAHVSVLSGGGIETLIKVPKLGVHQIQTVMDLSEPHVHVVSGLGMEMLKKPHHLGITTREIKRRRRV
jgi:hypothetical protein